MKLSLAITALSSISALGASNSLPTSIETTSPTCNRNLLLMDLIQKLSMPIFSVPDTKVAPCVFPELPWQNNCIDPLTGEITCVFAERVGGKLWSLKNPEGGEFIVGGIGNCLGSESNLLADCGKIVIIIDDEKTITFADPDLQMSFQIRGKEEVAKK